MQLKLALNKISSFLGHLLWRSKKSLAYLAKPIIKIFRKKPTENRVNDDYEYTPVSPRISSIGNARDEGKERLNYSDDSKTIDPSFPRELLNQNQEKKKEVSVNIYAPPKFERGKAQFIQVWLFEPEHKSEVEERAVLLDDEAKKLGYENLLLPIKKGTEITLVLSSKDIAYREQKSLLWMEAINHKNFAPEIPKDYNHGKVIFKLEVFVNQLIFGELTFMMKERIGNENYGPKPVGEMAKRFKRAFVSYASEDRKAVLERVQGIAATKVYDIFQDILDLEPGDRWEKRLYKEIDLCDVFFLFWSEASSQSEWVLKELNYAIEQKRDDKKEPLKIQPVILPPRVDPPKQLQHLHFNDRLVHFIMAEEQIRGSQNKNK